MRTCRIAKPRRRFTKRRVEPRGSRRRPPEQCEYSGSIAGNSVVTLSDGSILHNRRDAHDIIHLNPANGAKTTVGTVPNVDETDGEGGLLGLAISSPRVFASTK